MQLTVTIDTNDQTQISELKTLLNYVSTPSDRAETPNPKQPGKKAKAEKVETKPAEDDTDFEIPADDEPEVTITQKDLVMGFRNYAELNGREAAGKLLKKLGVKKVAEIPTEKYAKVMEQLNA